MAKLLLTIVLAALAAWAGSPAPAQTTAADALVYTHMRADRAEIVLLELAGRARRVLVSRRNWRQTAPELSPDGRRLAFVRSTDGQRSFRVFVARADGRNARRITAGRFDEAPTWSPDGRWIAYQSTTGIRIVRPDGTRNHALPGAGAPAGSPDWSPDGKRIAYAGGDGNTIWTASSAGRGHRRITAGRDPDWSPDGTSLAYTGPDGGVLRIPAAGGRPRSLGRGMQPVWSPDGARIAFARWIGASSFSVWVMAADGSGRHRVARDAADPSWRPAVP